MCGIFGFVGKEKRLGELIEGLKKLEYRGYDSAGIAYSTSGRIEIGKKSGKVNVLEEMYEEKKNVLIDSGISHTRWATHGNPNDKNAHPHTDCSGQIAVVHNGIIENFSELKSLLSENGHKLVSDTDTEVIAHLIEEYYGGDLLEAVLKAIKMLRGAFAIGVIHSKSPNTLIAAREGSPLCVGSTSDGGIIASDVTPILKYTKEIYFVDDGEIVQIDSKGINFFDFAGIQKSKTTQKIDWEETAAEKSGYKFFMEKEIFEEPEVIRSALRGRLAGGSVVLKEIEEWNDFLSSVKRINIIAAGTSYHAGFVFKYFLEQLFPIAVNLEIASELRYCRKEISDENTLNILISQSGETADTLECLKILKKKKGRNLAVSNVLGSTLSREVEKTIFINAGPEIGVASTKAYIGQLVVLYLLGGYLAALKGFTIKKEILAFLEKLPEIYEKIFEQKEEIKKVAKKYFSYLNFMYIGRNIQYPTALEGALKLKEISYINATAYPGGELKHGPIALLDEDFPVFAINLKDSLYEKMKSNIIETRARNAKVICLTDYQGINTENYCDDSIIIPASPCEISPLVCAPYIQLFAYYMADLRGLDIDRPRNLAKSVTVE